jgi:hypothetical protein
MLNNLLRMKNVCMVSPMRLKNCVDISVHLEEMHFCYEKKVKNLKIRDKEVK